MSVAFSDHAKDQLKRRRISQNVVLKTVNNPDEIISSFKDRKLRRSRVGGKILEIITKTEGNKITVVTGYFIGNKNEN